MNTYTFQMDIIKHMAAGRVVPLHMLELGYEYLILHIELLPTTEGLDALIRIHLDHPGSPTRTVYVILPEPCIQSITSAQVAAINRCQIFMRLVLLGITPFGKPIIRFYRE